MRPRRPRAARGRAWRSATADADVVRDLDVVMPDGRITMIVGANACGKSTLLRGLARLLRPRSGAVILDGKSVHDMRTRRRRQGAGPAAADAGRPRRHHGRRPRRPRPLSAPGLVPPLEVGRRRGGRRSRSRRPARPTSWTATSPSSPAASASASGSRWRSPRTPTCCCSTSRRRSSTSTTRSSCSTCSPTSTATAGKTIVIVLHDLNLACRYADHIIAMKDGAILAEGQPREVITATTVTEVFGLACEVVPDPVSSTPMIVPRGRHHTNRNGADRPAPAPMPSGQS